MYILAFSLDWFMTIPGILISLGVLLLIIAVILFATGNKKSKDSAIVDSEVKEDVVETPIGTEPIVEPVSVLEPIENKTQEETPKFEEVPMGTPGVDPINPVDTTVVSTNEIPEVEEPSTEDVVEIDIPEPTLDQTMVSVYGGENPAESVSTINEEPKVTTIYGGNDPLEATQSLPKVEEHHEPYGGAMNEVKIVEPLDEQVVEIPVVEPMVSNPIEVETPAVEEKEVSFEIPAAPVEIPVVEPNTTPTTEEKTNVEEL